MHPSSSLHPVSPVSISPKSKLHRSTRVVWATLALCAFSFVIFGSHRARAQSEEAPQAPPFASDAAASEEEAPSVHTSNWTEATAPPVLQAHYGFAQNGDDMYVISGDGGGGITNTLRRYNAFTNVWTSLANVPVGSEAPAAVFFAGKIYVAEGSGGAGNAFRIYDVTANTWSLGAPRPSVAHSFGAAAGAYSGNIYVVGGGASTGGSSVVSIYNIATNTWSAGPPAPSPYRLGGFAQMGQFLYLVGGTTSTAGINSSVTMRLDLATNTWSTGPAWTPQRADFGLAAAGTKLYAMGGDNNGSGDSTSAQVDELETSTWPSGAWVASPDNLPSVRRGNQAGFFSTGRSGGEIWSTSGFEPDGINVYFRNEHLFRRVVPCPAYTITPSTRPIVPATTDIGNRCDDCLTSLTFPFPITLYGTSYTSGRVESNGTLQFLSGFIQAPNTSLPATGYGPTIFPFWDDLNTSQAGKGIFTSIMGSAPNRVFNIEWRVLRLGDTTGSTNFELQFREGSSSFEVIYGATTTGGGMPFAGTIGVQNHDGSFTQFAGPNANVPPAGTRLLFTTGCCGPIAFEGAIGSGSNTYPGTSGTQTGRLFRDGSQSVCGTAKPFPGVVGTNPRTYDRYSFRNDGPATCMTFSVNSACADTDEVFFAAYLGSFDPSNIATNYLGDPGLIQPGFNEFSVNVPANSTVVLVVHALQVGGACPSYDVVASGLCPLELTSAASRKNHGAAGSFDIPLPLQGSPGVECRSSGGNHQLVVTFNGIVTSGNATVSSGIGSAGAPIFPGTAMIIPLMGVADIQKLTITLAGVTNSRGQVLPNTAVSMNVLLGDTNGDRFVNSGDSLQTRSRSGQVTAAANFRSDVNVSGAVNSGDTIIVRSRAGNFVP